MQSMTVAALGLPIPKFIIVIPSAVAQRIGLSFPEISTLFHSANNET
jgi:hypothetical protein